MSELEASQPAHLPVHFVAQAIDEDLKSGRYDHVTTRFPPEPNGFLHIGHAKAICIDFGMADRHGGKTHLRMDDTNPAKEEQAFIDAIQADVRWLGFDWDELTYASDTFDQLYDWACALIRAGHAYVDDQTAEEIRANRGDLNVPGTASPFRDRPVEESLDLFARMKAGEFADGAKVLRAKIDMASPNIVLRDPAMYRILNAHHPRTGDTWHIYPMYDWAHGQGDWIEGVTHSLCDLSFEIHRPLYEWFIARLTEIGEAPAGVGHAPRQIEFARGNITHLITSKRKLKRAGGRRARGRLGRPADADAVGPAAAGLHARGDCPLLDRGGGGQTRKQHRAREAGERAAGGPEREGPAPHGGAGPDQGDDHELPRGADRDVPGAEQSGE